MGGGPPFSRAQGPQFSFSQEDFLTCILTSLTEIGTVVFIFTLDGEREGRSGGVSRGRQGSDSGELSFFWVLKHLLRGRERGACPDRTTGNKKNSFRLWCPPLS